MIRQIWTRLQLMVAQGVGVMTTRDKVQVTVLDGEDVPPNLHRVESYGTSYRPPRKGFQAYMVFPAGDRSNGLCLIIGDKRYQMDLQEGEVALHDDEGNHVHIKRGGVIEVKATAKVIADTPLFETTGDARIGGKLTVLAGLEITGTATANGKNISESHTHTAQGANAVTTGVN